jgi:hypothetical protein
LGGELNREGDAGQGHATRMSVPVDGAYTMWG